MIDSVNIFAPNPKDKICIVVYGNIASGKSTFSKNILSILQGFNYVCLDKIRLKWYENYPEMSFIERERRAEEECLNQILNSNLLVYETTAATLFFKRVKPTLDVNFKTFYIYISCPVYECHNRFDNRKREGHFQVAPQYKKKMTIREMLIHFESAHYQVKSNLKLDSFRLPPAKMLTEFKAFFNWKE